ncbi:hypothetical protein FACS18949_11670 [Clostridia bacterium]|nr:hypothetical protein FACS189425_06580 [Clostridia bacterium]GHV34859.1 hypothetical protein FACS18949_11670 [Clostridia bacterium]
MDYPIRFFNVNIPTNRCNFRCHYCYIGQTFGYKDKIQAGDEQLRYSVEHMKQSLSQERLGGSCIFNLCANGETLLFDGLDELVVMLLELGHYVSIVTNGVLTKPLKKFCSLPQNMRDRLFIKASFHWLELKHHRLLNKFYDNMDMLKKYSISFTVELTVNDETIPEIPQIVKSNLENLGALSHLVESRNNAISTLPRLTKLKLKSHRLAWGQFQSSLFNFQQRYYENPQCNYCHAGEYSFSLVLQTGDLYQCDGAGLMYNIFENPEQMPLLKLAPVGTACQVSHCYIRYVYAALCGNYEPFDAPTYADERERICVDGTSWLTSPMRAVFERRLNEQHSVQEVIR